MKKLISIAFCLLIAVPAMAEFVIAPGISYGETTTTQSTPGTSDVTVGETRIDVKVGYILPMGLYLGGMYADISENQNGVKNKGNLIGPSIGYYSMMGFHALLTYHIMGSMETAGGAAEYTGGKGPQVDIGWVFPLSTYFAIGPQMTWRSIEFDKLEGGGLSFDTDEKRTSIVPYLSLWFMF